MTIIDFSNEYKSTYFVCLEDWSEEMKEAGDHKETWYSEMKNKGLKIKLAINENGKVAGMIQYIPIEHSFVEGSGLYFILCIWVHGYKKGIGDFQKQGFGKELLQAAENDVKELGAKGIAAWGLSLPFWMKARWFKKQGYTQVDKEKIQVLLWKAFTDEATPPRWIRQKKTPEKEAGKVIISSFINGWCPVQNIVYERAKRAASAPEFEEIVEFRAYDTMDRDIFIDWGIADGLFIDDEQIRTGPPPSYNKIYKKIAKKVKKLS